MVHLAAEAQSEYIAAHPHRAGEQLSRHRTRFLIPGFLLSVTEELGLRRICACESCSAG